ncbi:MAG: ABC transporter ATP-binding protein [Thauera sp.]|nr:ABC transporter ATP-binding protein [Thauera sp.]
MGTDQAPSPLLQIRNLHVAYNGVRAVRGIDLELGAGELVCLIGANGAGKTSTLHALAGIQPLAGEIRYAGARIDALPAHERVRRGIALVPEGRGIFARLTVEENLRMGAYSRSDRAGVTADLARVHALLPRMRERLHQVAGTLSGGEQQMLAIGRALLSRPRLLLLDEPSMGLAPQMVEKVFTVIQDIARKGVALLLVEQNARLALELATRGYVMDTGRIVLAGRGADLLADPRVRAAYLGEAP